MKYVLTDSTENFFVEFKVQDELVVPDTGTVTLTVKKGDGTIVTGYNNAAITPVNGSSNVEISIDGNSKDNIVELRYVEVYFEYNSKPHTIKFNYTILDIIDIPVTNHEVRVVLGLAEDELPDDYIDVIGAYEDLKDEEAFESVDVDTTLQGGTATVKHLIKAIKYKAALNILPTLELLALQSQQADNTMYRRFEKVDFKSLGESLKEQYGVAIGLVADSTSVDPIYATTGVGTDAVTGA